MTPLIKTKRLIQKHSSIGAEFGWVMAGQLLSMIGGLVTIKLLSNLLSKAEFGVYALLFAVVSFLSSVLYTPLGQVNMRFLVLAQQGGFARRLKSEQFTLLLLISVLSVLVLVPAAFMLKTYTGAGFQTYLALVLLALAMGIQSSQQFQLMAFRLRREASAAQMIGAIARPLAVFGVIFLSGENALSATYGLALGFFVLALAQSHFLAPPWKAAIEADKQQKSQDETSHTGYRDYLSYGSVYALIGLVTIIVLSADRWILSFWGSIEQVAIYAALMQVALAPTAFGFGVLNRAAGPIFFKSSDSSKQQQVHQFRLLLYFWIGACLVMFLFTWLFHYYIVLLLTNSSYAVYSYLLPWMVLGLLLERTAQVLEMKGSMMLKTGIYVFPRLLIIALVPLFEFVFLYYLGFDWLVIGLVCATATSLFVIALVNHFRL